MTLPNPIPTLRQFIRGVCALPEFADAHNLERLVNDADSLNLELSSKLMAARSRVADLERQLAELNMNRDAWVSRVRSELQSELTTEREAHAETREALRREELNYQASVEAHALESMGRDSDKATICSLRAQLDAVTRWRRQSGEPCPNNDPCRLFLVKGRPPLIDRFIVRAACNMHLDDEWRYIDPPNHCASVSRITVDDVRSAIKRAAPGADELNRNLETQFGLDGASAGLVLKSSNGDPSNPYAGEPSE